MGWCCRLPVLLVGLLGSLNQVGTNFAFKLFPHRLHRRAPSPAEAGALRQLDDALVALGEAASAEDIQTAVYTIGKDEAHGFASLRDWFKALYEILLGSEQGPRMGSFIALYGVPNTRALIAQALAGE